MAKDMLDEMLDEALDSIFDQSFTGKMGETLTQMELGLSRLFGIRGKTLRNLYVPKADNGTTEIDLLFLTKKGLVVIESKNYSGWIFGNQADDYWTASLPNGQKNRFYNPIKQNAGHIRWLSDYLKEDIPMISVVVFSERCTLKKVTVTERRTAVVKRDELYGVLREIWRKFPDALDDEKVEALYNRLQPLTVVGESAKLAHTEAVQKNRQSTCPKCGGQLVLRTARKGENAGKQFYGCGNYPRCRYIRNL